MRPPLLPASVVERTLVPLLRSVLGPPVPVAAQRRALDGVAAAVPLPPEVTATSVFLGDRPALRVAGPDADPARAVLLVHGGAFITGSLTTHRGLAAHLALAGGAPTYLLDHRLAPEHPHPAGRDDVLAALRVLRTDASVSVVGDSAGATLALLATLALREAGEPLPERLALLSPLVDLTLASSRAWTGRDPFLRAAWVEQGTAAYAGLGDRSALSPLTADLSGLPPLLVHVSEHERFRPEGEAFVTAARAAGVEVHSRVLAGLWHDPHVQSALVREAAEAVEEVGRWLRTGAA